VADGNGRDMESFGHSDVTAKLETLISKSDALNSKTEILISKTDLLIQSLANFSTLPQVIAGFTQEMVRLREDFIGLIRNRMPEGSIALETHKDAIQSLSEAQTAAIESLSSANKEAIDNLNATHKEAMATTHRIWSIMFCVVFSLVRFSPEIGHVFSAFAEWLHPGPGLPPSADLLKKLGTTP
jgi:hypothetical protein